MENSDNTDHTDHRPLGATPRTRIRRIPGNAVREREALERILDAGLVAHVTVIDDGWPYTLPVGYARDGERVLFHGSAASRLFRLLAAGAPTCLTVTLLDGLVLAKSAFESSMNYRSAMILGRCDPLTDDQKTAALERISEHLMPGRWRDIRPPSPQELKATTVLVLPLDEASVKMRAGHPDVPPYDADVPTWSGTVPLTESWGDARPGPDPLGPFEEPPYLKTWRR